jgi:hypothetical protein
MPRVGQDLSHRVSLFRNPLLMEALTPEAQLAEIREEIDAGSERVRSMQRSLDADRWQRKPASESWSAIECVEHINITNRATLEKVREGLDGLRDKPRHRDRFHLDLFGWLLVKSLSSRSKFSRSKTNPSFVPNSTLDIDAVLQEFFQLQSELLATIESAKSAPLDAHKMQSVFEARIKYNLYSALRIVAVHETRHLDQAERASGETNI